MTATTAFEKQIMQAKNCHNRPHVSFVTMREQSTKNRSQAEKVTLYNRCWLIFVLVDNEVQDHRDLTGGRI